MKETGRLLVALAIAGMIYSYAVQDREPESPSIPVEYCQPVREVPTRDGGKALGVLCLIPIPGSLEAPRNVPSPDFIF